MNRRRIAAILLILFFALGIVDDIMQKSANNMMQTVGQVISIIRIVIVLCALYFFIDKHKNHKH